MYTSSKSYSQLKGDVVESAGDLGKTSGGDPICGWLQYANCSDAAQISYVSDTSRTGLDKYNIDCWPDLSNRSKIVNEAAYMAQYYPCGLVANSMFADDFSSLKCLGPSNPSCPSNTSFVFSEKNIAFPEDKSNYGITKYNSTTKLQSMISTKLIPPPAWRKNFPKWANGYNTTNLPDLANWERFQVWMRVSGLSTFRKTWGRNDDQSLTAGDYEISVVDIYDVMRFNGTKALVFSTVSPAGSICGVVSTVAFISFMVANLICPRTP
ncbi:hypothetical protein HK096_006789, partial [Nowakowskiella sp. JEL0078]